LISKSIQRFLQLESSSGIVLILSASLAMLVANSPLHTLYGALLQTQAAVSVGTFEITKPLLLWINDGLMAVFFLLIGLEVKREILEGELSDVSQAVLPVAAAIGGIVVPSSIYVALNAQDAAALDGWAIPAATDIAFALGVVALIGKAVPESLKVFLLTIAIIDDLAAIGIIAIFYSGDLTLLALGLAAVTLLVMIVMNRVGVLSATPYLIAGIVLWILVLKSGVHATLAGVATALSIPLSGHNDGKKSPLRSLEHKLHPWVAYGIMPLFAFANAGIEIGDLRADALLHTVPLGILLGLVLGKPIGVTALSWIAVRLKIARLPHGANWMQLVGVGMLCGIGFTMSLFIASLAFEHGATQYFQVDRLGILAGSLLAAILGYVTLRASKASA
jgi:NhaA family Na+:H+ antiporter